MMISAGRIILIGCLLSTFQACERPEVDGLVCVTEMRGERRVLFKLSWADIDSISRDGLFYINEDKVDTVFMASGTLAEFFEVLCKGSLIGHVNIVNRNSSNGNSNFQGEPSVEYHQEQRSLLNSDGALQLIPSPQDLDSSRWREMLLRASECATTHANADI